MRSITALTFVVSVLVIGACATTPPVTIPAATIPAAITPPVTIPIPTTIASIPTTIATTEPSIVEIQDTEGLTDRQWTVSATVTIGGMRPAPTGSHATLSFVTESAGKGRVTIATGCNSGSAPVSYDTPAQFTLGPVALTKTACDSGDLVALDSIVLRVLGSPIMWTITDGTLSLRPDITDSGLQMTATDNTRGTTPATIPPDAVPTTGDAGNGTSGADSKTMLDGHWLLQSFITVGPLDPAPAGTSAGFHFEGADKIVVNTGCNTGSAPVTFAADGTFTVGPLALTQKPCDDPGLETRIVGLLAAPQYWSVTGNRLAIYPSTMTDSGMILTDAR